MIDKQGILEKLEKERQFAVQINLPQTALGIAQAMKIIEGMEEVSTSIDIDFGEMEEIEYSFKDEVE